MGIFALIGKADKHTWESGNFQENKKLKIETCKIENISPPGNVAI
jgi:hypothetical protein